jgi:hypothetical protein
MGSMQCNVEIGYNISICSGTKENKGKSWSTWPASCPTGCKPISSQQSDLNTRALTLVPTCPAALLKNIYTLFLQICLCAYNLNKHQTVYNTCGRNARIYAQICMQTYIYIYMYLWFFDYRQIWEYIVVRTNLMLYEVSHSTINKDYVSQFNDLSAIFSSVDTWLV